MPSSTRLNRTRQSFSLNLTEYHRKLKLNAYFGPKPSTLRTPFQPKSQWEPDDTKLPQQLKTLIQEDIQTIRRLKFEPDKPNLTDQEEEALEQLRQDTSIVIKPADKGSTVVIMDRTDYIYEAMRQLNDKTYYTPLKKPIFLETAQLIKNILDSLKKQGFLTAKQVSYLIGQQPPRPRYFYLLPKIHKPQNKWTIPHQIPPGRPIVSDCSSESYGIAEYIESFLTPISNKHPSYIKDTQDFIKNIRRIQLKEPCFLFTMDVNSLYTNIEVTRGMVAVEEWLRRHPSDQRPDRELLELLHLSLTRNDFEFNGRHFLQIKGTAMGKRFAPAYANIYMAHWEETAFRKCRKLPQHYFRYLDDIWGIWTHSKEDFDEFTRTLNGHHALIKIEPTLDENTVNFLDTTTYKGPNFHNTGHLETKVFFKPTDTHALLHKKSHHPRHTFRGILKSQFIRFGRICSHQKDREDANYTLCKALRDRGYPRSFLRSTLNESKSHTQNKIQKDPNEKGIIPLISTFSGYTTKAHSSIKNNFEQIMENTQMANNYKIISAYKRNPNLKDILVRAKMRPPMSKTPTHNRLPIVKNHKKGMTFPLRQHIPLEQANCVYIIECKKCPKQYIGETRGPLKTRLSHHRYNIRDGHKEETALVQHFQRHGLHNVYLRGLEHNPQWTTIQRRRRESFWIRKLDTLVPKGLNEKR